MPLALTIKAFVLAAGVNERQLFHGSTPTCIAAIVSEGFDCRLCTNGCYGSGTYFAESSGFVRRFSNQPDLVPGMSGVNTQGVAGLQGVMMQLQAVAAEYKSPAGHGSAHRYPGGLVLPGIFGLQVGGDGQAAAAIIAEAEAAAAAAAEAAAAEAAAAAAEAAKAAKAAEAAEAASFAVVAAATLAPGHASGVVKMVLARVVLGQQQVGKGYMKRPHPSKDSVYGNSGQRAKRKGGCASGVFCHVIFDNNQAYPEYVISLKQPGY
jgi:hypothetical protein